MSNDLVPVSGGGAVVPSSTGTGAVGEHVGDLSVDRGARPGAERQPEAIASLRREMLRDMLIDGMGEREIESYLPIAKDFWPAGAQRPPYDPFRPSHHRRRRLPLGRLRVGPPQPDRSRIAASPESRAKEQELNARRLCRYRKCLCRWPFQLLRKSVS